MGLVLRAILDASQRQWVECGMLAVVQWLGVAYAVHSVLQQTASVADDELYVVLTNHRVRWSVT